MWEWDTPNDGSFFALTVDDEALRSCAVQVREGDLRKMLKFTISPETAKIKSEVDDIGI